MRVYYISGELNSLDIDRERFDDERYHATLAAAKKCARYWVDEDKQLSIQDQLTMPHSIQEKFFLEIEQLEIVPITKANLINVLNRVKYITDRHVVATVKSRKLPGKSTDQPGAERTYAREERDEQ